MTDETATYAIYAATVQPTVSKNPIQRALFPQGRAHSFLMLVEEGPQDEHKVISELHFGARDKQGKFVNAGSKPLNMLVSISDFLGLEKTFRRAANMFGLSRGIHAIKGVLTGPRNDFNSVVKLGSVTGTPEHMLFTWNKACAAAVMINEAEIPFTAIAGEKHGPCNCHSGTKTVLSLLGEEFGDVCAAMSTKKGRDLSTEVPALGLRWPTAQEIGTFSLSGLKAAQASLRKRVYETSHYLREKHDSITGLATIHPV